MTDDDKVIEQLERVLACYDHDPVTIRTFSGKHVRTVCTNCGADLPDPDATP